MKKTQLSAALARAQQARSRPLFDVVDQGLGPAFPALQAGDLPKGWGIREYSLKERGYPAKPSSLLPDQKWNGEHFRGKTLLLYPKLGFGDMFQFVRYTNMVKARGGQVILTCHPAQADVLETCPGVDEVIPVVPGQRVSVPVFDLHLPVCALPGIFRTDLQSIPAPIPYLEVPSWIPHREAICELLGHPRRGMRIGCVWAGNPGHSRDNMRSIHSDAFAALGAIPGAEWFSFQHGKDGPGPFPGITAMAPFINNFSDTALALSGMDLVISVDTVVAHLAGAMGIPVYLLLSVPCDWRWLLGRSDSPWYPSTRIFRQPTPGDWASVIEEAVQAFTTEFGGAA